MTTPTVKIRMYRQGLGDCFLLTFLRSDGSNYYILIDCGVVIGQNSAKLVEAANDILQTTQGHLNLLVATHLHWDHISGFCQAREVFDKFRIDEIWMPWTENPSTRAGQQHMAARSAQISALRSAVAQMNSAGMSETSATVQSVLDFFGPDPGSGEGLAAKTGACSTQDAMDYLRNRAGANKHYCTPTTEPVHTLDDVPGVQVYVLGPPTDEAFLGKVNPSKAHPETYDDNPGVTASVATDSFLAAASPADDPNFNDLKILTAPFDDNLAIPVEDAQNDKFFRDHYFGPESALDEGMPDAHQWRQIDHDWLNVTSELALNLDNAVNNTSLVLAFELGDPGAGKVLLFAADAQVGNWLSWGKLSWSVTPPGQPAKTISSKDLLQRAVVYKVGHHGSHNATLAAQGLDLMIHDELIALIPVDHAMAVKKNWPGMPFSPMLTTLTEKTRGRIVRIDDAPPPRPRPTGITPEDWQTFLTNLMETPLHFELTIQGSSTPTAVATPPLPKRRYSKKSANLTTI